MLTYFAALATVGLLQGGAACSLLFSSLLLPDTYASNFTEHFGTVQSSGCAAQWYSTCEQDWDSAGDEDILALCTSSSNYGVYYKPADATGPGIKRTLPITSGTSVVSLTVKLHVIENDSRIRLRLIFKNSLGQTLATVTDTNEFDIGVVDTDIEYSVPVNAVSVEVGAAGLDAGTEFVVDSMVFIELTPSEAECSERAEERRKAKYQECEDEDGIPTGTCTGVPDASYVGGCRIDRLLNCYYVPQTPSEFQCPTGY